MPADSDAEVSEESQIRDKYHPAPDIDDAVGIFNGKLAGCGTERRGLDFRDEQGSIRKSDGETRGRERQCESGLDANFDRIQDIVLHGPGD